MTDAYANCSRLDPGQISKVHDPFAKKSLSSLDSTLAWQAAMPDMPESVWPALSRLLLALSGDFQLLDSLSAADCAESFRRVLQSNK